MAAIKNILRKTGKGFLYLLLGILLLVSLLLVFINTQQGKKVVRNQVVKYLENKLHTSIKIGSVDYSLPEWLELNKVYIEDQQKDTLLYGNKLRVNISMFKLLRGNTDIQKIDLDKIFIHLKRAENDSNFNFKFIVDAFTGNKATTPNKDTAELKITLNKVFLNQVSFKMEDEFGGTIMKAGIDSLYTAFENFQPDKLKFTLKDFSANGINYFQRSFKKPLEDSSTQTQTANNELYIYGNYFKITNAKVDVENSYNGMKYQNDLQAIKLTNVVFHQAQALATADSLLIQNGNILFYSAKNQTPVSEKPTTDTTAAANNWRIKANQINFNNLSAVYNNQTVTATPGFDANHLDAKNINTNITSFLFSADSIYAGVNQLTFNEKSGLRLDSTHGNFLYTNKFIEANNLYVKTGKSVIQKQFKLSYDSIADIMLHPQNALIEANLNNTVIAFDDVYVLAPTLQSAFPPDQFAHHNITIQTQLKGNLQRLYLPYLQLSGLTGTTLSAKGTLYHLTNADKFKYDLYILNSRLLKKDLLKFVPPQNQAQLAELPEILNVQGHFTGTTNTLLAEFKTINPGLNFDGKITLNHLQNPEKLQYNVALNRMLLSKKTILGFIPPHTLPNNINLPRQVMAKGKFTGSSNGFNADLNLGTDYGNLLLTGFLKGFDNPDKATYDLSFGSNGFNLGKLLGQDSSLGNVAGNFKAVGTGFDYKKMNTDIEADIASLYFNKYLYSNARLRAKLRNGNLNSVGSINDPNLVLNYDIKSNLQQEYPTLIGFVNVDTARLQPLQLYSDSLDFSLFANLNFRNTQPRALDIETYLDSINMLIGSKRIYMDTISLVANSDAGVNDINFKSPFAYGQAKGAFDYDKLPNYLLRYLNNYYQIQPVLSADTLNKQQINFSAQIKEHPFIKAFVPGLIAYDSMYISGKFSSEELDSALNLKILAPFVQYGNNRISQASINLQSKNEKINYAAQIDTLQTSDLSFYGTRFSGHAAKDSIAINVVTQDEKATDWFALKANYFQEDQVFHFKLKDSLLLNYEPWVVAPDNLISFGPYGLLVNNFTIKSDSASISAASQQPVANSPIDVQIKNFNLRSISSLISGDTLFASGALSANALISEIEKPFPAFTGTAQINDLEIMTQPLGNLKASMKKDNDNKISGNLTLASKGVDATAEGNYFLQDALNQFEVELNLKKLNMQTIAGLAAGQIKNSSGFISGNIKLNGKFDDPKWNGQLNFNDLKFTPTVLGAPYRIPNQKIIFHYPNINFNNFTIQDSVQHQLVVDGNIMARSATNYNFDVAISADDFLVMNAQKAINSEFYGIANIDARVAVNGNSEVPNLTGTVKVNDKSKVTLVLPENNYQKDEGLTAVKFIDVDTFDLYHPPKPFTEKKREGSSFAKYLNYNFNIEISKKALLTIVLDPSTGDEIQVQGGADLNAGVDPGGHLALAGIYELEEGYYNFSYQILARKFILEKGSTIQFSGAPMDAKVNITASYLVETSSKDLLSNEITSANTSMYNLLKQKMPFKVSMNLTGVLSRPQIKFSISLQENAERVNTELKTTIENKLNQLNNDEAAMNKQVFSLLLLGRFVGVQSADFFAGNGTNFADIARQSVSQFLSSALDQIAGDLIKGVDIDVALNSYEDYNTTGSQQHTDLNIALSKRFLNDRLTITVGKNFGLEGQDAASKSNGSAASNYIPDFTASYQLTKDGRYLIRGYRKNAYEAILDGYVIETGLSFVVTLDYEKFKEIFRRKHKKTAPAKKPRNKEK